MIQLNWYKIFGVQIPDGSTVLPTDDIQIWLHCANIWDKSYTTLAEVLADTTTLSALISSNNAVDYLVRSTKWAGTMIVPAMTDNTHPSGIASASGSGSSTEPYQAFDSNVSTRWCCSPDTSNNWLAYDFGKQVEISKVVIAVGNNTASSQTRTVKIQYENNGNYVDIDSYSAVFSNTSPNTYTSNASGIIAEKFRLFCSNVMYSPGAYNCFVKEMQIYNENLCDSEIAMTYIGQNNYCANTLLADSTWCNAICNSTYFESVLNVKVPTMTDNTTPSGECFANARNAGAYRAFNGDEGTSATSYWYISTTDATLINSYIGYKFISSNKAKMVKYLCKNVGGGYARRSCNFTLQGSNDNSTWTDVGNFTDANVDTEQSFLFASNVTDYLYYRIVCKSSTGNMVYNSSLNMILVTELQFYGREDV